VHALTRYLARATENSVSIEAVERHQSVLRSRTLEIKLISVQQKVKVKVNSCINFEGEDVRSRCSSNSLATWKLKGGVWSAPPPGSWVVTILIV